jgi:hypothetical protein
MIHSPPRCREAQAGQPEVIHRGLVIIVEISKTRVRSTDRVNTTRTRGPGVDPALAWSQGLKVEVGGAGTVAHAGIVLPRLLADRIGLTRGLSGVLARAGFIPGRDRGRGLVDAACALAAGAGCLSDIEAMTSQVEIFGPRRVGHRTPRCCGC